MKYLLDTNVLRELGKTFPHKNVAAWLKSVDDADLAISALTVRSSGDSMLDAEVLAMIERASPLAAPSPEVDDANLHLLVPVQFSLR